MKQLLGRILLSYLMTTGAQASTGLWVEEGHRGPPGVVLQMELKGEQELAYQVYLPAGEPKPVHVMVVVHGISRNVNEHLSAMRAWADEYRIALVLPRFDALEFHDYQRLGRDGYGPRADHAMLIMLEQVSQQLGLDTSTVDLFGYSGGAQFAHRFAMVHPQRIRRLGLGSSGWYTWPTMEVPYPFGVAASAGLADTHLNLDEFLRIPICVFVGERDTRRDGALNTSKIIDEMQGHNRRQRAINWVRALRDSAEQRDIGLSLQFTELPNTTHAYRRAVTRGGLIARLFECFYP